jgi:GH15 family glucan-1,4-alpha-glucosidase
MAIIEDYAFLSDTQTGALVSRDGSMDWLCFPSFDSGACFAALLGDSKNGRWLLRPDQSVIRQSRRYLGNTLILESEFETQSGIVRLIDFMPPRGENPDIVRIVTGVRGQVKMQMELIIRFDYGSAVPWVRRRHGGLEAVAGPDALILRTPIKTQGRDLTTVAEFTVAAGERVPFVLTWFASHAAPPREVEPEIALRETKNFWTKWARRCNRTGEWHPEVLRSLLVLKGLTYAPSGGIVAAATTSLPEEIGGVRNWDYRYCWLRDATFTLMALMEAGYLEEARRWRSWLLRAIAGSATQMQIMYGVRGERRLLEYDLKWLSGYEGSKPVRVGNAASDQFQLDVYGEVMDSMYYAHCAGIKNQAADWQLQSAIMRVLEKRWQEPDEGIWEVRGGRKHFTHSKMMAWVAFDRAVKLVEDCDCEAEQHIDRWRQIRQEIHAQVCERGWNEKRRAFTQSYGAEELDASILMMPLVGFLPPDDARVRSTIEAIERDLTQDGFVLRYKPQEAAVDGLPGREGVFLPCSFWLANCLHLIGRKDDARRLFERLLHLQNDLGLFSEEYDPRAKRQLGNTPQAFTHVALINSAHLLSGKSEAAAHRKHPQTRRKTVD